MSLMAIILWALNAFSPWRRLHERTRHLLDTVLRMVQDKHSLDWVRAYPDHPHSIPLIERALDDLGSGIDLLIYQRAREILGLNPGPFRRPRRSPPQSRRARSFDELWLRIEACAVRFADIERLAQRRAEKLARLLATNPDLLPRAGEGPRPLTEQQAGSGGGPIYLLAPPFEATAPPVPHQTAHAAMSADASLPRSGEEAGARYAGGSIMIFHFATIRAGLRVRAPP
jgi:hypothetical protein